MLVPAQPVTKQKFSALKAQDIEISRPVFAQTAVANVQVFSTNSKIRQYKGDFQLTAIRDDVLIGKTAISKVDIEIIYKLPNSRLTEKSLNSTTLHLDYSDDVKDIALQRRIILNEKADKTPQIISISEGNNEPYQTNLPELGLAIKQNIISKAEDSPTVTIIYKGSDITLAEGDQKTFKISEGSQHVHLLSSYAYNQENGLLLEGQAYYVNLIIYK